MILLSIPNLVPILRLMAAASEAVYEVDLTRRRALLEGLGLVWVGVAQDPERDITVCRWNGPLAPSGGANLSITQGTRFSENTDLAEIWDDVYVLPVETPYGLAPNGFWQPAARQAPKVKALGDPTLPWHHTGHSLGGQNSQLLLAEIPGTAWPINPPTGASREFWDTVLKMQGNRVIPLVHEREFAHGYMVGLDWHQPTPFLWLHHGQLIESSGRNGINIDKSAHDIESTRADLDALEPVA